MITCMVVFTILSMSAVKASEESVALTPADDKVLVTLHMNPALEAFSMKASFKVEAVNGTVKNIKFNFDPSMTSTINEYRFQQESNILTVYISGNKDLILEDTLNLGNISFDAQDNTDVKITFIKDSLQYVTSAYSKTDLALEESSAHWTNTPESNTDTDQEETNSGQGEQDNIKDPEVPTIEDETVSDNKDEIKVQEEGNSTLSNADTGVQINALMYASLAVISLIFVVLFIKRSINKANH